MSFNFINDKNKKVHFIGIGGISMSGLAEILIENGYKVSGSDRNSSAHTEKLKNMGAEIFIGHNADNIKGANIVVYTAAIAQDNPELIAAKENGLTLFDRAEFLGEIMKGHKYNIAVSGTHGKTTTTSMVSHILLNAKVDPTILVGGDLDIINGNVRAGNSDYFVTEACEYKESFTKFFPYIGIVLNIDEDHLDYYRDIHHIEEAFLKFASLIPKDGYLIVNAEDERAINLSQNVKCNVISYGISSGDLRAKNISFNDKGCASFDVYNKETFINNISLNVPGRHNVLNSLSAIASSLCLNLNKEDIKLGLESYGGTHRRFELKGIKNGVTVIDDYAHHPTEIKTTLSAAQKYPHKKIICVFQPHTYTRTKTLFNEFTKCFNDCDELILADIYAAREKYTDEVSSGMLKDAILKNNIKCTNIHSFDDIVDYLKTISTEGDIILTVGAGDVYLIGENFLK